MGWRKRDMSVFYAQKPKYRAVNAPCAYCGRAILKNHPYRQPTRDHVIPQSAAFSGTRKIVWACFSCNQMKGDLMPHEWKVVMREVPEWWKLAEKKGPRGRHLWMAMNECGFDMRFAE